MSRPQITLLVLLITYASYGYSYVIPTPEFVVSPNGLQISIPDEEGIEIFYFHGRIQRKNQKSLEPHTIALDTRNKIGNRWTVKEENVQLRPGDSINYWVFVRKNGVGYRNPTGYFEVTKDIQTPYATMPSTDTFQPIQPVLVPRSEPEAFVLNDPVNLDSVVYHDDTKCKLDCISQLKNMTETINGIQNQLDSLEKVVKQLVSVVNGQDGNFDPINNDTTKITGPTFQAPTAVTGVA